MKVLNKIHFICFPCQLQIFFCLTFLTNIKISTCIQVPRLTFSLFNGTYILSSSSLSPSLLRHWFFFYFFFRRLINTSTKVNWMLQREEKSISREYSMASNLISSIPSFEQKKTFKKEVSYRDFQFSFHLVFSMA